LRFTGQVRIPDVDHPGVPADILVEDDQMEVVLEGESLGRWSIFDVHATRLVSAAFSLVLSGEEITFIADEPVDFAYKGVERMAEGWARFKAMTLPRRTIAVKRSRKGTKPSRIAELRDVMLQNLKAPETVSEPASPEPVATTTPVVEPVAREIERIREEAPPVTPEPVREEISSAPPEPVREETSSAPPQPAPLRPGPGLFARAKPAKGEEPEPELADVPEPERVPEPVEVPEPRPEPVEVFEPEPEPEPVEVLEPEPEPEPVEVSEPEPEPVEGRGLVAARLGTSASDDEDDVPADLVVDLGSYEEVRAGDADDAEDTDQKPLSTPGADRQPAMTGAPNGDRSGLFGAVRNAFVRNKAPHAHEFVEAPGGIGIVRQICSECGYISIGVND